MRAVDWETKRKKGLDESVTFWSPFKEDGMTIYKVFCKNYELRKGELLGVLIERRKDFRGITPIESGLKWARLTFGDKVVNKQAIYVVPDELRVKNDANCPI